MRGVLRSAAVVLAVTGLVAGSASTASAIHVRASATAGPDPLIAAAGDIACDPSFSKFHDGQGTSSACRAKATGDLVLANTAIDAVLALGDNQYQCGGYKAYLQSFDPAWGRFKSIIHPVPGDNEYETSGTDCASGAAGYFRYFGAAAGDSRGDYAWTLGAWRLIALNAECGHAGGCGSSSAQATFLKSQMGAATCTLVYWHQPYYKGTSRPSSSYAAFWKILYAGNADVVLNGHLHNYSRFAPQDASGHVDPVRGVRQFIVGTGGRSLFSLDGTRNVETTTKAYGLLEMGLHATSYDWKFVNTAGKILDSGTASCH
jgi:Calcineurin-like phosphoesterase